MVYDKQNRLVATQDGNLRSTNPEIHPFGKTTASWLFNKYDKFGRVVYTGTYTSNARRSTIQNMVDNLEANNETRGTSFTQNGINIQYSRNGAFPQNNANSDILSVNYYDDYNFPGNISPPTSVLDANVITPNANTQNNFVTTKGLPTASFVSILDENDWEKVFTFYDAKSRPIRTHKLNHLEGYTKSDNQLDFRGKSLKAITQHKRDPRADEITTTQLLLMTTQSDC